MISSLDSERSPLAGGRILITGGTGFVGRALLRHLTEQAAPTSATTRVTVLTRSPGQFLIRYPEFSQLHWLTFHAGDILAPNTFPGMQRFTHVLHAAADSVTGPQYDAIRCYDQIVMGTRNLLDFAAGTGVRRFLLTSSGAAYGAQPAGMKKIPEDYSGMPDPLDPRSVYGMAKRTAEHLCALYQDKHGIETVIARCFAFVGPDLPLDAQFAIGNFIRDALTADVIRVNGDGTPQRTYLDQADLAHWLQVLLQKGAAGEAYNVGSDEVVTIGELAHLVRDLLAPGKPVSILGRSPQAQDRNRYVPDISKARRELGLEVGTELNAAIRRTAQAHRKASHP